MKAIGLFFLSVLLTGCVSTKDVPSKWPAPKRAETLSQFEGSYFASASGSTYKRGESYSLDDLGVFVAEVWGQSSDTCRLVYESGSLWLERASDTKKTSRSKLGVKLEEGVLLARETSHGSLDPLGVGGTKTKLYLYLAEDGSVIGRVTEKGAALFLWVVPLMGSGENWLLWKKVPIQPPVPTRGNGM